MAIGKRVTITNEGRAWHLLEQALSGDKLSKELKIAIGDIENFSIHVKGADLHGTLPSRYLPALAEYQESIFKIYSYVKYEEYSIRRLKDEEKRSLELVYKVKKGTSDFGTQIAGVLEKIGVEATAKMSGEQLLAFLCLSVILFAGYGGLKLWLNYKQDKLSKDITGAAVEALSAANKALADNIKPDPVIEKAKIDLLKKAIKSSKAAQLVYEGADAANTRLALSMAPGDEIDVQGVFISGEQLRRAATAPRESSKPYDSSGPAILMSIDNSISTAYVVGVKFIGSGFYVVATVENDRLIDEERKCVGNAVISRQPVHIHVDGKWRRGSVVDGKVLSVRELTTEEKDKISKKK